MKPAAGRFNSKTHQIRLPPGVGQALQQGDGLQQHMVSFAPLRENIPLNKSSLSFCKGPLHHDCYRTDQNYRMMQ